MSEDQFTKLFVRMEKGFDEINKRFETVATKESVDRLTDTIDSFIARLENIEIEQTARDAQFNRIVTWAREVSAKTGIPLKDL